MFAISQEAPGGPETLVWKEVPDPTPGDGEVVIDVTASAVNRADLLQRQGLYPPPTGASEILGLECSGVVRLVSPEITAVKPGDNVVALLDGGGYAQRVSVPVGQLMSVPAGLDLVSAAALPEVACTVWSNLVMTAHLQKGEWVLIHGGASGIGTMAIQVAKSLGAKVIVTAGSQLKLDMCRSLGADVLIDYKDQDFVEVCHTVTNGFGVNVILDNMGAAYLNRNVEALARNGRLAIIGLQGGAKTEFNINSLLRRNGAVHGTSLRGRPSTEKAEICRVVETHLWPLIQTGTLRPVVDRILPMKEAARAHKLLESGEVTGKLVLENF